MEWLEAPEAVVLLIAVAAFAGAVYLLIPSLSGRTIYRAPRRTYEGRPAALSWADRIAQDLQQVRPPQQNDQLSQVMAASFTPKRIMNKSEYDVFRIVEREVDALNAGYRVFAQTCLGEILASTDPVAFGAINAKRTDMLVVAPNRMPCFAVEYQGKGHHQSQAAARDAIKKEALRKAGIGYLEILHTHSPEDTHQLVRMQLRRTIQESGYRPTSVGMSPEGSASASPVRPDAQKSGRHDISPPGNLLSH